MWEWWKELIDLPTGSKEESYLEPIKTIINNKITAADWIKTRSLKNEPNNKDWLIESFSPLSRSFL